MKFKKSRWISTVAGVWGARRIIAGDEVRELCGHGLVRETIKKFQTGE